MSTFASGTDELLDKINTAVRAANEAEQALRDELVSRSKTVGLLLLEAKKLHPTKKQFHAFLSRIDGLKISRAYDMMRLAGGRTTDEQLREDARNRQAKSRVKKKKLLPKPEPDTPRLEPKLPVESVTVTDSAEVSAEEHKTAYAEAENTSEDGPRQLPRGASNESRPILVALERALVAIEQETNWPVLSANKRTRRDKAIREFKNACNILTHLEMPDAHHLREEAA